MRSDPIVSNRISSNLIDRDKRSNRAMRLDAIRLLKTLSSSSIFYERRRSRSSSSSSSSIFY